MLRKETKSASEVILATDDDREGEAIAWHICQICKLSLSHIIMVYDVICFTIHIYLYSFL